MADSKKKDKKKDKKKNRRKVREEKAQKMGSKTKLMENFAAFARTAFTHDKWCGAVWYIGTDGKIHISVQTCDYPNADLDESLAMLKREFDKRRGEAAPEFEPLPVATDFIPLRVEPGESENAEETAPLGEGVVVGELCHSQGIPSPELRKQVEEGKSPNAQGTEPLPEEVGQGPGKGG